MAGTDTMSVLQQQRDDTDVSVASIPPPADDQGSLGSPRQSSDLSYMHRPPTIMPNYGKKSRSVLPKSNVSRVLLYDNITQQTMLDVRLNSIQSQSHKTNRELDMHMKSFISRRKSRQKALKNLTRVQHHEDYLEFQKEQARQEIRQQQYQSRVGAVSIETSGGITLTGNDSRYLPKMGHRSSSFHNRPGHSPTALSVLRKQSKSVNSNHLKNVSHGDLTEDANDDGTDRLEDLPVVHNGCYRPEKCSGVDALPQISLSAPSSLVRGSKPNVGKYQPLDQDEKIGYRMVKGPKGYTRIFHSLPGDEIDQIYSENDATTGSGMDNKLQSQNSEPVTSEHFLPKRTAAQNRKFRSKQIKLQNHKKHRHGNPFFPPIESHVQVENAAIPEDQVEEPLNDFRFLDLRRILIPQKPPNEGYTELSPSFPRRYPIIKDVMNGRQGITETDRMGGQSGENDEQDIGSDADSLGSELS